MLKSAALAPLYAALLAAQRLAVPIETTARGETQRAGKKNPEVWAYAPGHVVAEQAHKLLQDASLLLLPEEIEAASGQPIKISYRLVHVTSGASLVYRYSGPLMSSSDFVDSPQAVAATERYAWRCTVLRILAIPVVPEGQPAMRVEAETPPSGWGHPDEPPPLVVGVPPYSVERCLAAMNAWCEHETLIRRAGDPQAAYAQPEDATAAFLADNNMRYERRQPRAAEWPALYYWLRTEALSHGYKIEETG